MKKYLALFLTMTLLAGLLAACGSSPSTAPEAAPSGSAAGSDAPAGEAPSVILLVPGTLGDKSFFDSANNGIRMIADEYGCKTAVIEMTTDTEKYIPTIEDVIAEGWDIIITGGINISQPMQEMAAKYPDQKFILYDETVDFAGGKNANVFTMTYKANEGAFLAGALAGMVTSSPDMPNANEDNVIGFAGGFDIPLINDWLVGYIKGAQSQNPDVKVGVGYMDSFTDAPKGKEVALSLYNSGADIIIQAAGGAGLGVLDAAAEQGRYAVGTDSDQAEMFAADEAKANAILTSVLKRVDLSIVMSIGRYIEGTLEFGANASFGIAEGCFELADNEWYKKNVPQAMRDTLDETYAKLASGEITVPSAFDMSDDELVALKKEVQP